MKEEPTSNPEEPRPLTIFDIIDRKVLSFTAFTTPSGTNYILGADNHDELAKVLKEKDLPFSRENFARAKVYINYPIRGS